LFHYDMSIPGLFAFLILCPCIHWSLSFAWSEAKNHPASRMIRDMRPRNQGNYLHVTTNMIFYCQNEVKDD